ncbi:MAG TPA: SpoVR family protein [Pirellulales bacterium]|jgi:stage V sporulation protein R|nr:SpoVR family protein [Pirellulales bacterium]
MATVHFESLPSELAQLQGQIESYAARQGLDFFPTIFELVEADELNAIAAYGGFPTRYPHWRFGMEYEQLSKGYHYGLQKIYELVINNNPCYAYLMKCNSLVDQKLVMCHVYGHCDFFKNNAYFSQTSRKMMDEMANHGNRIRRHMDRQGVDEVETFIDACLSIEDLIDIHSPFIKRYDALDRYNFDQPDDDDPQPVAKFHSKGYMESFINPPQVLAAEANRRKEERVEQEKRFPAEPMRDVMLFLLEHAPLKPWQLDVLAILRDEAYYFAPQAQTKIMNEGWASYWHSSMMTRMGLIDEEVIHYCDHHSGTLASSPDRLNPYKLGIELFRDIEDRWNTGRFGKEYDECEDFGERQNWKRDTGLGRQKIFEVRRIHNDLTFIDEFLTLDFCRQYKLFSFGYNPASNAYEIESREFPRIKQQLLFNLTNVGRPLIAVRDGNYKNRGELFLEHQFNGVELKISWARDTLVNLYRLWNRPVHIETVLEGTATILSYDGTEQKLEKGGDRKS